ncbi:MAG TPA: hypothetical protein PKD37_01860 [Oligoflexia bacterium]|nr:hypothetical protein [Oligoflexia bacterium]HMP26723.1 hypothetical protein [Oligoflexia bacterium]
MTSFQIFGVFADDFFSPLANEDRRGIWDSLIDLRAFGISNYSSVSGNDKRFPWIGNKSTISTRINKVVLYFDRAKDVPRIELSFYDISEKPNKIGVRYVTTAGAKFPNYIFDFRSEFYKTPKHFLIDGIVPAPSMVFLHNFDNLYAVENKKSRGVALAICPREVDWSSVVSGGVKLLNSFPVKLSRVSLDGEAEGNVGLKDISGSGEVQLRIVTSAGFPNLQNLSERDVGKNPQVVLNFNSEVLPANPTIFPEDGFSGGIAAEMTLKTHNQYLWRSQRIANLRIFKIAQDREFVMTVPLNKQVDSPKLRKELRKANLNFDANVGVRAVSTSGDCYVVVRGPYQRSDIYDKLSS